MTDFKINASYFNMALNDIKLLFGLSHCIGGRGTKRGELIYQRSQPGTGPSSSEGETCN